MKGRQLLEACRAGDAARVQTLLGGGAPAYYQVRAVWRSDGWTDGRGSRGINRLIDRNFGGRLLDQQSSLHRSTHPPRTPQEPEGGSSCLMHAAQGGHLEIVRALLAAGAPWNALDRQGKCAGEYAMAAMAGPQVGGVVGGWVEGWI